MFLKKKQTVEESEEQLKRQIRDYIREYPQLYYELKKGIKKHGAWYLGAGYVIDGYRKLKDPVEWAKKEERRNQIYAAAAQRKAQEEAQKLRESIWEERRASEPNAVQCPYCKSYDTHKIGVGERAVSVAAVGIASNKLCKQWHCNKCKSNF